MDRNPEATSSAILTSARSGWSDPSSHQARMVRSATRGGLWHAPTMQRVLHACVTDQSSLTSVHPGVTRTAFGAEEPSWISKVITPLWKPFMSTLQRGAETSVYLASSSEVETVTGRYFAKGRQKPPARRRMTRTRRPVCGR